MRVFGVVGWKNAGKTTLVERLVAEITGRGLVVSTVKRAHHAVDVDQEGTDSWRHRAAGAREVMLASSRRYAIMHELRGAAEPSLDDLLARMSPVDLVLVEGFKRGGHDKIEVRRAAAGGELLAAGDPTIRAVASDHAIDGLACPVVPLDDVRALADVVLGAAGVAR